VAVSPGWRGVQSSIGVASSWKNRLGLIAETLLARGEQMVVITTHQHHLNPISQCFITIFGPLQRLRYSCPSSSSHPSPRPPPPFLFFTITTTTTTIYREVNPS